MSYSLARGLLPSTRCGSSEFYPLQLLLLPFRYLWTWAFNTVIQASHSPIAGSKRVTEHFLCRSIARLVELLTVATWVLFVPFLYQLSPGWELKSAASSED